MRIISAIIGFVLALLALCFALANRQDVSLSLWPFDVRIGAPLYLLSLGTLVFGLAVGAILAWFCMLPHRFVARKLRKEIISLQAKIENLQQTIITPIRADATTLQLLKRKTVFWKK